MKKILSIHSAFVALALLAGSTWASILSAESSHFETVDAYLEQGGILYGFMDVEGDITRLAKGANHVLAALREMNPGLAMVPETSVEALVRHTGLASVQAIGLSSTRWHRGFHNRTFILTDGAPTGLLALFGMNNAPFGVLNRAPAGADLVAEQTLDLDVLVATIRDLAEEVVGPDAGPMIDGLLETLVPETTITVRELIQALSGRSYFIAEVDASETMDVPELGRLPKVHFLLRFESGASIVSQLAELPRMQALPDVTLEADGDLVRLRGFIPANNLYDPVVLGNQSTGELFVVSSEAFYDRCMFEDEGKLADESQYARATEGLPESGYSMNYVSPGLGILLQLVIDRAVAQGATEAELSRPYLEWSLREFMADYPMASIATVESNGLFVASNWSVSHKRNLATAAYANPVTVGLMAAMAIPAFQKVRTTSQEKANP